MEVVEETPNYDELEIEEVAWFSFNEALEKVTVKREKQILAKAGQIINKPQVQSTLFNSQSTFK